MTLSADAARNALRDLLPVLEEWTGAQDALAGQVEQGAALWSAVEAVLRPLVPDMALPEPRELVAAIRQQGLCTLDEAHALVDFHASTAGSGGAVTGTDMRAQLSTRLQRVLTRIVHTAGAEAVEAPLQAEYSRAASVASPAQRATSSATATVGLSTHASPGNSAMSESSVPTSASTSGGRSSAFVVGLIVVSLIAAGITAALFTGIGRPDPLASAIAAYEAGDRMAAAQQFSDAYTADTTDVRPLVYIGRIAREEGDIFSSRRALEQAITLDPKFALAHREMGSTLLASGLPMLARNFYVRAVTLDPKDLVAQGFLGCALTRLGRKDEAQKWLDRAGPGDWDPCRRGESPSIVPRPGDGPPGMTP